MAFSSSHSLIFIWLASCRSCMVDGLFAYLIHVVICCWCILVVWVLAVQGFHLVIVDVLQARIEDCIVFWFYCLLAQWCRTIHCSVLHLSFVWSHHSPVDTSRALCGFPLLACESLMWMGFCLVLQPIPLQCCLSDRVACNICLASHVSCSLKKVLLPSSALFLRVLSLGLFAHPSWLWLGLRLWKCFHVSEFVLNLRQCSLQSSIRI